MENSRYSLLKYLTIFLQTLMIPLGTFVGYQFGAQNYRLALIALVIQTILVFFQGAIWWRTFEERPKPK
jgi:uncharacterized membrane protein